MVSSLQQILLKVARRLTIKQRKFVAEVIDAKMHGVLGVPFIAFAPFVGVAIGVYLFGRVSMAYFNPTVTAGLKCAIDIFPKR